ncbi:MAG: hypothetical protein ACKPKO_51280, partial [Candidatus Fonsibacter sp.]
QVMRLVRRLPHLHQIAREDILQPGGATGLQQRGAPFGQRHTLLYILQYDDVKQINIIPYRVRNNSASS